jgi:hypothetical protein
MCRPGRTQGLFRTEPGWQPTPGADQGTQTPSLRLRWIGSIGLGIDAHGGSVFPAGECIGLGIDLQGIVFHVSARTADECTGLGLGLGIGLLLRLS